MQPSSVTRCEGVIKASYRDAWQMAEITGVFCGRVARDKVGDVSHFTVCAYEECLLRLSSHSKCGVAETLVHDYFTSHGDHFA